MYKSQLQEYAQKASIPPPVYEFEKEGASHEPRFKAIVILNNVTYESPPGFPNLKSAEHAAAKVALDGLLQATGGAGVVPNPVHESGLCKNLLQEYAQKNSLPLPVYQSQRSGEDHAPTFTSSVEIAGVKYSGGFAKNKKEAEIKAARTALLAIQSAQASMPAPDSATAPQPNVGLATLISTHLNNASGKKRGRGAVLGATDEPSSARVKTSVQVTPAPLDASAKATSPAATSEKNENAHVNGANVPKKGGGTPQPKVDQPASVPLKSAQAPEEVSKKDAEGKSTDTETDDPEKKTAPETKPEEVTEKQQTIQNAQSPGPKGLKTR